MHANQNMYPDFVGVSICKNMEREKPSLNFLKIQAGSAVDDMCKD